MARLEIRLLGSPDIRIDGQPVKFPRRKSLALFVYLVVTAQPQSRDALATLFWPEDGGAEEKSVLQQKFLLPAGYTFTVGDQLSLVWTARDSGATPEKATATMAVQYADGTPPSVSKIALNTDGSGATPNALSVMLKSGKVSAVKVSIKNKATSGTMILDYFVIGLISAPTRDSGVLPLPAISQ